ncbi:hypothetical protein JCM6882_000437 [Rhodosporidiobolus microsporus]
MSRPFSPDSTSSHTSAGDHSTPSSASRRVCRAIVVDAHAHDGGVRSKLLCKLILPTSSPSSRPTSPTEPRFHLLDLTPHSRLVGHVVHALPLQPGDSNEAVQAARTLGLTAPEGGQGSIGRRRSLSLARMGERRDLRVERESDEVAVVLLPAARDEEDEVGSPSTARAPSRAESLSPTPSSSGGTRSLSAEFIVVLEIETSFGVLKLPKFANTITIPTPLCLRNTLSFTLPPPPSSPSASWDLSVRPSLSSASSATVTSANSPDSTQITGTFPTSSALSLRWAPQLPPGVDSPLVIPRAALDVRWTVQENCAARAEVEVHGSFECAALREKQWVEMEVGIGRREGADAFEVARCDADEETPVISWETAEAAPHAIPPPSSSLRPPPPVPPELDDFASPLDDSLLLLHTSTTSSGSTGTEYPFTPTPASRPRPLSARANEPRPPSFTSLFDTAPPAALGPATAADGEVSLLEVQLPAEETGGKDRASRQKGSEGSSLMGQEAPFDPEGSTMDMSFEVAGGSEDEGDEDDDDEKVELLPPPSPIRPSTRVRVQLDLSPALRQIAQLPPDSLARPSFAFILHLDFPPSSLSSSSPTAPARLSLPTFGLLAAASEETVVTVSAPAGRAGDGRRVELLPTSLPPYRSGALTEGLLDVVEPPPSPLPGIGGRARWATVRGGGDMPTPGGSRIRKISAPVEVEVVPVSESEQGDWRTLAGSEETAQQEQSRVEKADLDPLRALPIDDLELPRPPTSTSTSSFLPSSESSSPAEPATIPLVQLTITPVPPSASSPVWRFFHRLVLAHPYRPSFSLAVPPASAVEVVDAWNGSGENVLVEAELSPELDEQGNRELKVSPARRGGVTEVLYLETRTGMGDDAVEVGGALPVFEDKVARLDVEVVPPQGHRLDSDKHSFDLASTSSGSTTFTRFLLPPKAHSTLSIRLQPDVPPTSPSPVAAASSSPPHPSPSSISSSTALRLLQTLFVALCAVLAYHLSFAYFSSPSSLHLPAVVPPSLPSLTVTQSSTLTSTKTTFLTHTITASAPRTTTETLTSPVIVTTTHFCTSTVTSTTTSTHTVSPSFIPTASPSSSPSSSPLPAPSPSSTLSFSFADDFSSPSPASTSSPPSARVVVQQYALDLEDTARSAMEAVKVWLRRVSWRARGLWNGWGWVW